MAGDKKLKKDHLYTTDTENTGTSVPSITQLLNRKKLEQTASYNSPPPKPPKAPAQPPPGPKPKVEFQPPRIPDSPPPTHSPEPIQPVEVAISPMDGDPNPQISLSSGPSGASGSSAAPKVQAVGRRGPKAPQTQLVLWDLRILQTGGDPMGHGLARLFEQGASSAIFLAIAAQAPGSPVPVFMATAAVNPAEREPVWTGMRWDPTVVPETWNNFVKAGFVELTPPGTTTNQFSNRNIVRVAFGIKQDEWLLLVRSGPANGCRGVLAIISKTSLSAALPGVLPLIQGIPGQKAA